MESQKENTTHFNDSENTEATSSLWNIPYFVCAINSFVTKTYSTAVQFYQLLYS